MSRDSSHDSGPADPKDAPVVVDVIAIEVPLDDPTVQAELHRLADEDRRERGNNDHREQRDNGQRNRNNRDPNQRDNRQGNDRGNDRQNNRGRNDRQANNNSNNNNGRNDHQANDRGRQNNDRKGNERDSNQGHDNPNRDKQARGDRKDGNRGGDRRNGNRGGSDQHRNNGNGNGNGNGSERNQKAGGGHGPSHRAKLVLVIVGIVAAALAILFAVTLHLKRSHADKNERDKREDELAKGPEIPIATVIPAPKTRKVTLPGDVKALKLAVVYARVSGYLEELSVDRGDKVVKDQVLGRVTAPDTEQQLGPLIASLNTKSVIANRLRPLVTKGVVSQQDLDRADAEVQEAKSEVDRLKAVKSFDVIRAPFDGVVTKRYVDVGALMPAPTGSTQSSQPLVDVADTSKVRVVVYVGQRDATGVRLGDHLLITRDDDPTHPIEGSVTRIPMDLDLRTRTMWVECELPNPDGRLYPGLFVTVTLDIPAPDGVLIPSDAVAIVSGKPTVARIDDDRVKFVPVVIADDDGKVARVVAGLHAGETIATRVSDELADGAKVRGITPEELRQKRQQEQKDKKDKKDQKGDDKQAGSGSSAGSNAAGSNEAFPGTGSGGPPQAGSATPNFTGSAAQGTGLGAAGSADTAKGSNAGRRSTP